MLYYAIRGDWLMLCYAYAFAYAFLMGEGGTDGFFKGMVMSVHVGDRACDFDID